MSLEKSIFSRDLRRLARSADAPRLVGRQNTDPNFQAEANYFLTNGETRQQTAERTAIRHREEAAERTVADLNGNPPDLCNTKGLSPARALLAQFFEWQHREAKRLDDLRSRKAELEAMISAPAATEEKIRDAVRKTAAGLLGRDSDGADVKRDKLNECLAKQRHLAEAATVALCEIDRQIETAELRVARLGEREDEFVGPALVEAADEIGLGKLYLKKITELRAVTDLMYGLASAAGGYGSGFGQPSTITFTKMGLPSLADTPSADYVIPTAGNAGVWNALAQALRHSPRTDASRFISVPK